jgi:hypothetical protein
MSRSTRSLRVRSTNAHLSKLIGIAAVRRHDPVFSLGDQ